MKCSLFTANNVDGIIAKEDGSVDLLHASGKPDVSIGEHFDIILELVFTPLIVRSWAKVHVVCRK